MLTISKTEYKVASTPLVIGSVEFRGPWDASAEADDAPGLIAIFSSNGVDMRLLNLYQTVSVKASAILEIGYAPESETSSVVFAVHYTEGMAAHSRSRMASSIMAEVSA